MAGNYDPYQDIWPGRLKGEAVAPVRVGIDRRTGRIIAGWPHVEQSIETLFSTRYHERIMRYWVGSFVPHLIGRNASESTITRFWWAIATAIELWEPCYAIQRIAIKSRNDQPADLNTGSNVLTSVDDLRKGNVSFQVTGLYMPRGHLGDKTPAGTKSIEVLGSGSGLWNVRTQA